MRIGIIAEGRSDIAVIQNILKGVTGLNTNNFIPIVPIIDNTSKAHLNPDTFSSWSVVKTECINKPKISKFLKLADSTHIVIHLDTAEASDYGIILPSIEDADYCKKLRDTVIAKIKEWLGNEHNFDNTLYAIAIQEIDSWVLTIYSQVQNCEIIDAKKAFKKSIPYKYEEGYKSYNAYSQDFSNKNKTEKKGYLNFNCSLRYFWEEASQKLT